MRIAPSDLCRQQSSPSNGALSYSESIFKFSGQVKATPVVEWNAGDPRQLQDEVAIP